MACHWLLVLALAICSMGVPVATSPIVLVTWNFVDAANKAWCKLSGGASALDAVEAGATKCEELQCDGTVGYGGSPDEHGETTLDALIMDGRKMNVGAVGALRNVKNAISVARKVLEHTSHSLLVGEQATQFAVDMGFKKESLTTSVSKKLWRDWREQHCQPNFWQAVSPDPTLACGPYHVTSSKIQHKKSSQARPERFINEYNHDTIGLVAIDANGDIAAGTSTNGAKYKIPGRVGDSPIPGSGAYADNTVGGAAATGDGDIMLRFCPSFLAVDEMRRGATPTAAAITVIKRIAHHYPGYMGAVIAVRKDGAYGAACHGLERFPFTVHDTSTNTSVTKEVFCIQM